MSIRDADIGKGHNQVKSPWFLEINPNGRIPTLIDHKNGDFAVWESDAILLYLADKYDTEKRLTVTDEKERYSLIQWLFFQASGQGSVLVTVNSYCAGTHSLAMQPVLRPGCVVPLVPP